MKEFSDRLRGAIQLFGRNWLTLGIFSLIPLMIMAFFFIGIFFIQFIFFVAIAAAEPKEPPLTAMGGFFGAMILGYLLVIFGTLYSYAAIVIAGDLAEDGHKPTVPETARAVGLLRPLNFFIAILIGTPIFYTAQLPSLLPTLFWWEPVGSSPYSFLLGLLPLVLAIFIIYLVGRSILLGPPPIAGDFTRGQKLAILGGIYFFFLLVFGLFSLLMLLIPSIELGMPGTWFTMMGALLLPPALFPFVLVKLAFVPQAVMLGGRNPIGAILESARLSRGRMLPVAMQALTIQAMAMMVALMFMMMAGLSNILVPSPYMIFMNRLYRELRGERQPGSGLPFPPQAAGGDGGGISCQN